MKKTITNPDGSVEVVEGTADEIAEYERKRQPAGDVKEDGKKKGKRVLLSDSEKEELRKLLSEELQKQPHNHYHFCSGCHVCQPYPLPSPIWVIPDAIRPWLNPPWPGYPEPYIGDLPGWGQTTTDGTSGFKVTGAQLTTGELAVQKRTDMSLPEGRADWKVRLVPGADDVVAGTLRGHFPD